MINVRRMTLTATILLTASLGVGHARAGSTLGIAGDFGEFVFGDSTRQNTDARGPVAVGGNATFTNFGVATSSLSPASGDNLVVGGNLTWTQGQLHSGTGVVAGTITTSGVGGAINQGASPIDFGSVKTSLLALSSSLANDSTATTVSPQYGSLTFGDASSSGIQVFNVQASDVTSANSFTVRGTSASTVIINVLGTSATWSNAGFSLGGGLTSSHVLWNFVDATSLTVSGIGIDGTVLAAKAAVTFNNGQINGSLIAASLTGGGETHIDQGGNGGPDTRFDGHLPGAVPEPASVAMLGMAVAAGLGLAARRRVVG